jgi:hypothetical protein
MRYTLEHLEAGWESAQDAESLEDGVAADVLVHPTEQCCDAESAGVGEEGEDRFAE